MPKTRNIKHKNLAVTISVASVAIFSTLVRLVAATPASAFSISMEMSSHSATVSASPAKSRSGAVSSDPVTISVSTDSLAGYTFSAQPQAETALKGTSPSNSGNSITSITGPLDATSFPMNTWGYLPSKLNGIDNTLFQPWRTIENTVIEKTATTGQNSYTVALGARVDSTLPAGSYSNTFVFTAVANDLTYSITYDANGGTGAPANVDNATVSGTTATIGTETPTKTDYDFMGWCDQLTTDGCSGTTYQPGGTWTLSAASNSLTLWAMWSPHQRNYTITYNLNNGMGGPAINPATGSITTPYSVTLDPTAPTKANYNFQGWCDQATTNEICTGTIYQPSGPITVTTDNFNITLWAMWQRVAPTTMQDFGDYCNFMPQDNTTTITLTDTRDNNTYTVAKLKDNNCWMTQNLRIAGRTLAAADSDVANSFNLPASSDYGFSSNNVTNVYVDSTYGGYYTWYAATAGEGTSSVSSGDLSHSICPKGWRLPSGAEFNALAVTYGGYNATASAALRTAPANFLFGGNHWHSISNDVGNYGAYWSSTAYSASYPWYLFINSLTAGSNYGNEKFVGFSVRCVAR